MYVNKTIRDYLNRVEGKDPYPGGGSVSSLVSSLGGALTLMTSNFSFNKKYFKELDPSIQEKVRQNHKDIKKSIEKLNQFIDKDAEGFASVIEAYEKEVPESKEERKKRLEESYKGALTTPLDCSRECLKLLKLQSIIVEFGNDETITDVGVGVILVYAALEGCLISVKINLNYIDDENYTEKIQGEMKYIYKEAFKIKEDLVGRVEEILNS